MNYIKELREIFLKPEYKHISIQAPGTGIVIWRENNGEIQILLQKRGDFMKYGLFGGAIELGETYERCAERELYEEAGIKINQADLCLFKVYAGPNHITEYPNGDVVYHTVVTYILDFSKCESEETELDKVESVDEEWFSIEELKTLLDKDPEEIFFHNNIPIIRDIVDKFLNMGQEEDK